MLIVLLFLVFKVVIPFVKNKLEANDQKEIEKIQELTSSEKNKKDFEEGNISEDKYVQQLAYEEFEKSKWIVNINQIIMIECLIMFLI